MRSELKGKRVGKLTCVRPLYVHPTRGVIWLCQCDCGNLAYRSASYLNLARKRNIVSGCRTCGQKYRAKIRRTIHKLTTSDLVRLYHESGTLYSFFAHSEILEYLPGAYESPKNEDIRPWVGSIAESPHCVQAVEVSVDQDQTLICHECKAEFNKGFGCPTCVEPICPTCYEENAHPCFGVPCNLRYIGKLLGGLTRERVRQIEAIALQKLQDNPEVHRILGLSSPAPPKPKEAVPVVQGRHCGKPLTILGTILYCSRCGNSVPRVVPKRPRTPKKLPRGERTQRILEFYQEDPNASLTEASIWVYGNDDRDSKNKTSNLRFSLIRRGLLPPGPKTKTKSKRLLEFYQKNPRASVKEAALFLYGTDTRLKRQGISTLRHHLIKRGLLPSPYAL